MPDNTELHGTWRVVSAKVDGQDDPEEVVGRTTFEFAGDTILVGDEDAGFEHGFRTFDQAPVGFEIYSLDPQLSYRQIGIYELAGDELRWCWSMTGNGRPLRFSAEAGEDSGLYVLRREAKQSLRGGG